MAKEYTKISGRGGFILFRSHLWLAKDHLLLVTSTGYTENYRRFYFRDIRGMTVTRTWWRMFWNILWATFAGLFAIPFSIAVSNKMPADAAIAVTYNCGGLIILFIIFILINSLRGPTCAFHITTAIQTEKLPPLNRVSRARKFIDRIRPLVLAAQEQPSPAPPPAVPS